MGRRKSLSPTSAVATLATTTTRLRLAGLVPAHRALDLLRRLDLRRLDGRSDRLPPFGQRQVRVLHLLLLKKFHRLRGKRSILASWTQSHDLLD